jgi:hypothetical protein
VVYESRPAFARDLWIEHTTFGDKGRVYVQIFGLWL